MWVRQHARHQREAREGERGGNKATPRLDSPPDIVFVWAQIRSIVTLGCGGIVDLKEFLDLSDEVKCYVIDAHRPLHLSNIHGDEQVSSHSALVRRSGD